jgi:hypothetical protein
MSDRNKLAEFYDAELANVTGRLFDALNENKRLRAALEEIRQRGGQDLCRGIAAEALRVLGQGPLAR